MSYSYNLFDCYYDEQMTVISKMTNFLNQGVSALCNGKRFKLYTNSYGDDEYKQLDDRPLKLALIISFLVLPLLLITIPLKIFSSDQERMRREIKRLDDQKEVMGKLKKGIAAVQIQTAFKKYQLKKRKKAAATILQAWRAYIAEKRRVEPSVIKIQRAFRAYQKHKKEKAEEERLKAQANKKPFLQSLVQKGKDYIVPHIPYVAQKVQQFAVQSFMDMMWTGICSSVGLNYADVRHAAKIENMLDQTLLI